MNVGRGKQQLEQLFLYVSKFSHQILLSSFHQLRLTDPLNFFRLQALNRCSPEVTATPNAFRELTLGVPRF
jgi:hypothetical protein